MAVAWVQSLAWELRSLKPRGVSQKKKEVDVWNQICFCASDIMIFLTNRYIFQDLYPSCFYHVMFENVQWLFFTTK